MACTKGRAKGGQHGLIVQRGAPEFRIEKDAERALPASDGSWPVVTLCEEPFVTYDFPHIVDCAALMKSAIEDDAEKGGELALDHDFCAVLEGQDAHDPEQALPATLKDTRPEGRELLVRAPRQCQELEGVLVLDDMVYGNWEEVIPILKSSLQRDKMLRIVVRGDANVPAGEIQRVMNLIGEAGIADIAFASSNK